MAAADTQNGHGRSDAVLWLAYGQVSAVLGAISLLVFVSHFVDLGLRGMIADAVQSWRRYVRPVVGYPLQAIVNELPASLRFQLSPEAKDYFAVGLVSIFSFLRLVRTLKIDLWHRVDTLGRTVVGSLLVLVAWPVTLVLVASMFASAPLWLHSRDARIAAGRTVLWLMPLAYLAAILALNRVLG